MIVGADIVASLSFVWRRSKADFAAVTETTNFGYSAGMIGAR